MANENREHIPVLLTEVLAGLNIHKQGVYIDCTFGRGGHSQMLLRLLDASGRLIAIDRDPEAVSAARTQREFAQDPRFTIYHAPFSKLEQIAMDANIAGRIDGILFDLGVSSPQFDRPERGFSLLHDGPLDMRMDPSAGFSVAEWLATASDEDIAEVFWQYGEERYARRLARAIVARRGEEPIVTTRQLAGLIEALVPRGRQGIHPATRCFQALRIFINKELSELADALPQAVKILAKGGRLAVISFHSLEDRIVKRFMRQQARPESDIPPDLPVLPVLSTPVLRLVNKSIRAEQAEILNNPRARSAVLRIAEKL